LSKEHVSFVKKHNGFPFVREFQDLRELFFNVFKLCAQLAC
jgi:hypothetical protein